MKIKMKSLSTGFLVSGLLAGSINVSAEEYIIDTEGMHAFVQFRVAHLGYSWIYGRFNKFSGKFNYDESAPEKTALEITIDTASVDSNHAERDKHLRGDGLLNVEKFPKASFVSTRYIPGKNGGGTLKGDFTLHGVTHPVEIAVTAVGAGNDPWGGYRRGFEGSAKFAMADYGILKDLGPSSKNVELILSIEGVRINK